MQLSASSRAAIVAAALACFSGAFAFAPITARSAGNALGGADLRTAPDVATAPPIAVIAPRRDPFDAAPDADAAPVQPVVQIPRIPTAISGLPSNLNGMIPLVPGSSSTASRSEATRVSAVVTGVHPYALVVENNATVLKAIGDTIDGSRITAITMEGVLLEGGALRRVTSSLAQALRTLVRPDAPAVPVPTPSPSPPAPGSPQ